MTNKHNPSEVARETLRQLALRRSPPTPDNYRALYHEIAGTAAAETFPERNLKNLVAGLPRTTPEQLRFARQLEAAIAEASWDGMKATLSELLNKTAAPPNWSGLFREVLSQLENRHAGLTSAKKRESLDHVLQSSGSAEVLFARLQSLTRTWAQGAAAGDALTSADDAQAGEANSGAATPSAPSTDTEIREMVAHLLENTISVLLPDSPELSDEAHRLAGELRAAGSSTETAGMPLKLKKFNYRLQFVAEDQTELRSGLLHLLRLIIDNISELVSDDQWIQGQVGLLRDLISQPLNLRRLDDVETRLKDLIYKQSSLKKNLNDARDRLKTMLASFVDRLANFATTTGEYHDRIGICAEKISKASDIAEISDVLDMVMQETRTVQLAAQRSRDELTEMRSRVQEAEQEVARLQEELTQASELVRHDPLTGVLNRKGMDEALSREVARTRRRQSALCLAMLDIDNFKRLNDTYGHDIGDAALVHLAQVVRDTLRPQDTLARYGGEEFVIVLTDTHIGDALQVMVRVQRELTRRFFLHRNEKLLITFSCGVAELDPEENPAVALKRADDAMYMAKRAGKNRVVAA